MRRRAALLALALLAALPARSGAEAPRVLDAFESSAPWSAVPASGVSMKLSTEPGASGQCLRVDFDFQKGGGYAVLHRALPLDLPANYRLAVRVRGETRPQNLELKLLDASGENVWWKNRVNFAFPAAWTTVVTRKRQIEFAWGPTADRELRHADAIEFAITAGSGGKGTVWFDDLTIEALPPPSAKPPGIVARASSAAPGSAAALAADTLASTVWRPAETDARPWLELDLGELREFGGLTLDWAPGEHLRDYDVTLSDDGLAWRTVARVRGGNGGRDWFSLPECEARRVRVVSTLDVAGRAVGLAGAKVLPLEVGASENRFVRAIAEASPRGWYPRGMRGEMSFWSVVGTPLGKDESFLSADGALDLGVGRPSVEPFLWAKERLWTWADVTSEQTLEQGELPLPSVRWQGAPVELTVAAIPYDHQGAAFTRAVYTVRNRGAEKQEGTLYLAYRPYQVNPPSQFLNSPGGACELRAVSGQAGSVFLEPGAGWVKGTVPGGFGATMFAAGDIVEYLAKGRLPPQSAVVDSGGRASAAQAHPFDLAPGDSMVVTLDLMLSRPDVPNWSPFPLPAIAELRSRVLADWRAALGPAEIRLPASARELERTLRAQIGWIQVNRDSAAIQPGSRAYARSWIRDGALTATALLRWGKFEDVRRYLLWFAPFQYADGKVPCCVDQRGSDPVPEHDSHGEFIYLVAEYLRHTGDRATALKLWPHVASAAAYLDTLRAQRLGPEWEKPENAEFRGVLPPSISHEGYSAKPMHSYWDDFWALQGYEDAAWLAGTLGHAADARRIAASLEAFRRDFAASIAASMAKHRIDYVPGCADLGDFDATSTTIAVSPVEATDVPPAGAIDSTFARYWKFFSNRRDGRETWEAFTPYEMRNIGAFVRLGRRDQALELVNWFMTQRTPPGWAEWAEVVWNAPTEARFIGDLPHTWVGSDFVRSTLDLFAYEDHAKSSLVLLAGVPLEWALDSAGVSVKNLSTEYGPLSYTLRREAGAIVLRIERGPRLPRGGVTIAFPPYPSEAKPGPRVTLNGRPVELRSLVINQLPAVLRFTLSESKTGSPGR